MKTEVMIYIRISKISLTARERFADVSAENLLADIPCTKHLTT
jgi:hypothetical protein